MLYLRHSSHRVTFLLQCLRWLRERPLRRARELDILEDWLPDVLLVSDLARVSISFIAFLKPRIPSPRPLPSSGSFLGPNTNIAMVKITSKYIGCSRAS